MGITKVQLKVANPWKREDVFKGDFLVDSGAQYTVIPQNVWKKLGMKPVRRQRFTLADGKVVTRPIGHALIEYAGAETVNPIVLGRKDDSLLLGVVTLESLGLALDPFKRKLYEAKLMM